MLSRARIAAVAAGALVVAGPTAAISQSSAAASLCRSTDWPVAWHDVGHLSSVPPGCTSISPTTVPTLTPRWFARSADFVTASPVVVGGSVYVGAWNGVFSSYDASTGKLRWSFQIRTSSPVGFGEIVSTASVLDFDDPTAPGHKRLVAIFGGGSSLWALDAATGHELATIDLDPRDAATKAAQAGDSHQVEVESSPAVTDLVFHGKTDRRIFVGLDVHDDAGVGRTGVVALHLNRGSGGWAFDPIWKLDAETHQVYNGAAGLTAGSGTGFGCGGVWSSPAVSKRDGLVVFGTASCSHPEDARAAGQNWSEEMVAARADTGKVVWTFRPNTQTAEAHLDDDFGASANVFTNANGVRLVGEGRKTGCYYARYAATGRPAWQNCTGTPGHVSNDFAVGGFLGTTAVQTDAAGRAIRVIGATAIPVPHSAGQVANATVVVRAMDPVTGATQWTYRLAGPTYSSVSVAGGVVFVPDTFTSSLIALSADRGLPLAVRPVAGPPSSAPAVVGDSVYVSAGTGESGQPFTSIKSVSGLYRFALPSSP